MNRLAFILAILTLSGTAFAKEPKASHVVKIHVCESVDLYQGSVDENHTSTRIAESCRDVSIASAQKAMAKCSAQTSDVCEVLVSADKKTIMVEHKIVVGGE